MFLKRRVVDLENRMAGLFARIAGLETQNAMMRGELSHHNRVNEGNQTIVAALLQSGLRVWVTDKRTEEREKRSARGKQAYANRKTAPPEAERAQLEQELFDRNHAARVEG